MAMKILVVGSGGREHALAWKLANEGAVVSSAPGNPGMALVGECFPVKATDIPGIIALAEGNAFDLVVVGPELPLTMGLADELRRRGVRVFGPGAGAARIEGSKIFAKELMARQRVPTARFEIFDTAEAASKFVKNPPFGYPLVVKADGLAAGKGVVLAETEPEALDAVRSMLLDRKFGQAGERIIIEECLEGPEVSFFALCCGGAAVPLGSAQDYKRVHDGNRGPNTGGMGSLSPSPLIDPQTSALIMDTVINPVLDGLSKDGHEYRGLLYAGMMMTADGPRVLEFNCRFGDPETQALMLTLGDGLAQALAAAADGRQPDGLSLETGRRAVCVVLASRGYPEEPETGIEITGIDEAQRGGAVVFHAGTVLKDGRLVTGGGRVLAVCASGSSFEAARSVAYEGVSRIRIEGAHYRRDIAAMA